VARFLVLWRQNPDAPAPTDPSESLELNKMMFAGIENLMESGEIEEFGFFADGRSGYSIGKGETIDTFRNVSMFLPYVHCEVHEIIPFKKGKETAIAVMETIIGLTKK
jgi:hypothetical protein